MSTIRGIDDSADRYREFGERVLNEASAMLERSGIKVFPQVETSQNENVDSCLITKKDDNEPVEKSKAKSPQKEAAWIREAMPTHKDPSSILSSAMNSCQTYIAKCMNKQNNKTTSGNDGGDTSDSNYEINGNDNNNVNGVKKLANSGCDEGEGNLLQTLLEKDVHSGFHSSNFIGTNYKRDISISSNDNTIVAYSDNLFNKNNMSVIFGGTTEVLYSKTDASYSKDINYNAYAYGKYKASKFTYGVGAMDTKSEGVNYINVSAGVKHNLTGMYAIIQKDINMVPGLSTQTVTNINVGIGQNSGYLEPDSYKHDTGSVDNIEDIDGAAGYVEGKESDASKMAEDKENENKNTVINLIISDTGNTKEYGVKGGYIFRKSKNNNYAFIMPYGQISNTNINSAEGLKLILGTNAGQNITTSNSWNIKTKCVVECSRQITCGQKPTDYALANVNFRAAKNKFSGEAAVGGYLDNKSTFSQYAELKASYAVNDKISFGVKGGLAHYQYDKNDENKKAEFAVTLNYGF